jgi:hypothetical protein
MMKKTAAGALRDAVMITGAQKVEHYEMASYGTAGTYATVLGETAVARLLAQTLKEEKGADQTLAKIAEGGVNKEADEEWHSQEDDSILMRTADWAGSTAGYASRQVARGLHAAASTMRLPQLRSPKSAVTGTRRTDGNGRRRSATKKR